ncbi:MAG: diguanylate cyclase [Rhodospirillales bacterium]|nr:diguanylate cyclase [Rhodospirillales bacterium]
MGERESAAADWRAYDRLHNLVALVRENRIVYLNQIGLKLLGLRADQAVGADLGQFFHADYRHLIEMGLEIFVEEEGLISTKFLRHDQTEVDVELWVSHADSGPPPLYLIEARDVSAHLRAARALHDREKRLEGILNTVADGIITINKQGLIESFNPAAEKIFGFTASEVLGKSLKTMIPTPYTGRLDGHTEDELAGDWLQALEAEIETVGQRKDGQEVPLEMAVREMRQGEKVSFTGIVRDITKRKEAERLIRQMAHYDNLTGLPNRYLLGDRLEKALTRARRHKSLLALMFVDLDRFKPINDEFGHAAGDHVLREVGERLRRHVRAMDTVARVGGDEFVVVLEDLADKAGAKRVATKIMESLNTAIDLGRAARSIGASIGLALYPLDAQDLETLTECADKAMYAAKNAGRGVIRFFGDGAL